MREEGRCYSSTLSHSTHEFPHTHPQQHTHPEVAFLPVDLAISGGQVSHNALLACISVNGWGAEPPIEQGCLTSLTFPRNAFLCGWELLNLHRMSQEASSHLWNGPKDNYFLLNVKCKVRRRGACYARGSCLTRQLCDQTKNTYP